ncbi:alpha/beta fold hydrolase [Corallococcus macrosporus]|uniref:Putative alpha/beta hydrolase fold protein n=1 Tax=Myxococcus fulvus (strain ATCC BAA-855 / HW-1) TaxID=483219 RepID=F8CA25_MYXFH|nr:alpha/beta hydrolase [Corallococcus macrosporus]AEI63275.1 putative alpha/beta hydrolase fold protein [Corallococcus macrosporus]
MLRRRVLSSLLALSLLSGCASTSGAAPSGTTVTESPTSNAPVPFRVERSGKGRPVVFIPGLASSGEVWSETVAHLGGQYDSHVLTLAGFAGQPAISAPFFETQRRAVAAYLREQGLEKPILVGHSLGGVLALAVAADVPELVGGLVVVDSLPFLPAGMYPGATVESSRPHADQMRTQMRTQPAAQRNEVLRQTMRRYITDAARQDVAFRWGNQSDPDAVAQAMYELMTTDLRPALHRITAPTLVLGSWIALKGQVPRETVEAVYEGQYASLPNARVVMHDTARHFIMWDDPAGFFRELDGFLGAHAPVARVEPRP